MSATPAADAVALERIRARRRELRSRMGGLEDRMDAVRELREEWTDEEHDPEGFTLVSAWSLDEGSRAVYAAELRELDDAETRVADGTYGVCERCGQPIPDGQLALRPARRVCVSCAESGADHGRRR